MINSQNTLAVFFDFDGVLCADRFYVTLEEDYPSAWKFINENIFGENHEYAHRWMKGELTSSDINEYVSAETGIPFDKLTELFKTSVRQMKINPFLIQFAQDLKLENIKTTLVTGNMDIFNEITIPDKKLDDVFPVIINSFDYKLLKHDENGKLFDIALEKLGLNSYKDTWLIDDSPVICDLFTAKGGKAYQYSGQKEFERWLKKG
jgi:FMN phosphatase YigB (HAD superfamily)